MTNTATHIDYTFVSWNIRGLHLRFPTLESYVHAHHPTVLCLQEAFPGNTTKKPSARSPPRLSGYRAYCHPAGAGLVTYIKSKVAHSPDTLLSPSTITTTYYLGITIFIHGTPTNIYNIHSLSNRLKPEHLPSLSPGMPTVLMGDFNAKHPSLGGTVTSINGRRLCFYLKSNSSLLHIPTIQSTHIKEGFIDHVLVQNFSTATLPPHIIPNTALISDHWALTFRFQVPSLHPSPSWRRPVYNIPACLLPPFLNCIAHWYSSYHVTNVNAFSLDLTSQIHQFHGSHIRKAKSRSPRPPRVTTWAADPRLADNLIDLQQTGNHYLNNKSSDNLFAYLTAARTHREMAKQLKQDSWHSFLQSLNISTPIALVWRKINCIISTTKPSPPPPCFSASQQATNLVNEWALRSRPDNLPNYIQHQLNLGNIDPTQSRVHRVTAACTLDPAPPITVHELRTALLKGRATSPGEDGITYDLLRHLSTVPGNPLLALLNLSLQSATLPESWTNSIIIPIPKPHSSDFRPISLTSCVCKVMERIILHRLLHTIGPSLSPSLYGFLPGRSTQHCFAELFTHYTPNTYTAFIDLKAAFDIANREVILDELVNLGIVGATLTWIQNYLSNRNSFVYYKGARSPQLPFYLGTPQGGVLSPFLFNVLMHRLIRLMGPLPPDTLLLSYADDICISTQCPELLQRLLDNFALVSAQCGLVVNTEKTKLHTMSSLHFPITLRGIQLCTDNHYKYLGAPMSSLHNPTRFITDLCSRLRQRLAPMKILTNRSNGASIPLARSFYILYVRALIDYHALHLSLLPRTSLKPLEKLQNEAMRIILHCSLSTRIISMRLELNLPTVADRVQYIATSFATKILHHQHSAPTFVSTLKFALANMHPPPSTAFLPGLEQWLAQLGHLLTPILHLSNRHPDDIMAQLTPPPPLIIPPPSKKIPPDITYSLTDPKTTTPRPLLLSQVYTALDSILITFSLPPDIYYTDGSLSDGGHSGAAYAMFHKGVESATHQRRLPNWSSSTASEREAILDALRHAKATNYTRPCLVVSDSTSALAGIQATTPTDPTTTAIQNLLHEMYAASCPVKFLWIPSHVGYAPHDRADALAKGAQQLHCDTPPGLPNLATVRRSLRCLSADEDTSQLDAERSSSVSIQHYDLFRATPHRYGQHPTLTRRCDVAVAWIRLGYRTLWEVTRQRPPQHDACKLCNLPLSHTLQHYILICPETREFRPPGMSYKDYCDHLINDDSALEDILQLHPSFLMS